jgi:hypothetical protein
VTRGGRADTVLYVGGEYRETMSKDTVGRAGEPLDRLEAGGWELDAETTETLFSLPTATVEGHTCLYEDPTLRAAVREAGGPDHVWRFFFATAVEFSPSLSPGMAPIIKPSVVTESARRFEKDLRERGFRNVTRGSRQNVRVQSGERARLTDFKGSYPLSSGTEDRSVAVRGYLAVWEDDGFRLAGGAYPESGLMDLLAGSDVTPDGNRYREELLTLIRAVG